MENGWVTPNANPCVNDIKFNLLGEKGMIAIDASNHNMIQKYTDTQVIVPDVIVQNKIFGQPKGFAFESIRAFVDGLISGQEFPVTLKEAALGVLAILRSWSPPRRARRSRSITAAIDPPPPPFDA